MLKKPISEEPPHTPRSSQEIYEHSFNMPSEQSPIAKKALADNIGISITPIKKDNERSKQTEEKKDKNISDDDDDLMFYMDP